MRLSVCICPVLHLRSPPCELVHSHDSVSWKGSFLGRERPNHTLAIVEPRLLTHTSMAHELTHGLVNSLNFWSSLCSFFPCPSHLSLSPGHFPKKSNTDTETGLVQLLFPQCTGYINIPYSLHRSGRLMTGTHWSKQRLSLQNLLTLLRAGSFHSDDWGLCKRGYKTVADSSNMQNRLKWYRLHD